MSAHADPSGIRPMPEDFCIGTRPENGCVVWRSYHPPMQLAYKPTMDSDENHRLFEALRMSVWQALEMHRLRIKV